MKLEKKQDVIRRFMRGQSLGAISVDYGWSGGTLNKEFYERIIRAYLLGKFKLAKGKK